MDFTVTEADYAAACAASGLTEAHFAALRTIPALSLRALALLEMAYLRLPPSEAEAYTAALLRARAL